jgi:small subunit ribosomal protein S6e
MAFKVNISHKGKTIKKEVDNEALMGRKIGEPVAGSEIGAEFSGYELEISGTSDKAGFPGRKDLDGPELKKVLLTRGFGMHKMPKREGKKKRATHKGLRLKKTLRGNTVGSATVQINAIVKKEGATKFEDLLPKKEAPKEDSNEQPEQTSN